MKLVDLKEQIDIGAIETELRKLDINSKYFIHPDGTVDVDADVNIPSACTLIPVNFGKVSGNFSCRYTNVRSLVGAPSHVGGDFSCRRTKITSLVGAPIHVSRDFYCADTNITSLAGAPSHVGGDLNCYNTPQLTAILLIMKIKGIRDIRHEAEEIIMRHYKPDGTGDIIALQDDLIEAGFGHIARMK